MNTALILSPVPTVLPVHVHADTQGSAARAGVLHGPDQQRRHLQSLPERDVPVCEAHGLHQLVDVEPFHVAACLNQNRAKSVRIWHFA